jgi:hypothetical protein
MLLYRLYSELISTSPSSLSYTKSADKTRRTTLAGLIVPLPDFCTPIETNRTDWEVSLFFDSTEDEKVAQQAKMSPERRERFEFQDALVNRYTHTHIHTYA